MEDCKWMLLAACQTADPKLFFSNDDRDQKRAKLVCQSCEVRQECLDYALAGEDAHGIFGGLTPNERWKLLSKQAKPTRKFSRW